MRNFNHTVGVLVKAYLEGTLEHCDCHACAVGNMVAESIGASIVRHDIGSLTWSKYHPDWIYAVGMGRVNTCSPNYQKAKQQAESTGYTFEEIARIEYAFENIELSGFFGELDVDGFKGLMAVVDVLAEIHGIDLKEREEAKALFVKA